jgi:sulfur-carrier protein
MNVKLRYFASIRESVGTGFESLHTQATTVAQLRGELLARGGAFAQALAPERAVRVALNQTMCDETTALADGCEVAFFPPVTGG